MSHNKDTRHVRVELTREDHKTLRVAAALRDQAMAEFARQAVLSAASKVTGERTATPAGGHVSRRAKVSGASSGSGASGVQSP
jgi:uncharacterized protein (DUF1778 family)